MAKPHAQFELIAPSASPEEAAAIVAALERFMRATAPSPQAPEPPDPWRDAAIAEGVSGGPQDELKDPWLQTSG